MKHDFGETIHISEGQEKNTLFSLNLEHHFLPMTFQKEGALLGPCPCCAESHAGTSRLASLPSEDRQPAPMFLRTPATALALGAMRRALVYRLRLTFLSQSALSY